MKAKFHNEEFYYTELDYFISLKLTGDAHQSVFLRPSIKQLNTF